MLQECQKVSGNIRHFCMVSLVRWWLTLQSLRKAGWLQDVLGESHDADMMLAIADLQSKCKVHSLADILFQ